MSCRELCDVFAHDGPTKLEAYNLDDVLKKPAGGNGGAGALPDFYALPQLPEELASRPWKNDPEYFKKVYILALALTKMTLHAKSGGNIEVMGMLVGKIVAHGIVVMDVYQLPVEGTETRVNAQAEGYEYMVQFSEALREGGARSEHIVGWYHSHPGYGCWLSGIDVSTQALNQGFQDPYLALVVDPVKTLKHHKVEIGAFRTYPEGYKRKKDTSVDVHQKDLPVGKRKDFGVHADRYYLLDIELFSNAADAALIPRLLASDDNVLTHVMVDTCNSTEGTSTALKDDHLNRMAHLTRQVTAQSVRQIPSGPRYRQCRKYDQGFAKMITQKVVKTDTFVKLNRLSAIVEDSVMVDPYEDRGSGYDDADDESDLERKSNPMSDGDDVLVDLNLAFDDGDDESSSSTINTARVVELRRELKRKSQIRLRIRGPDPTQAPWNKGAYNYYKELNSMWTALKDPVTAVANKEMKELLTMEVQNRLFD